MKHFVLLLSLSLIVLCFGCPIHPNENSSTDKPFVLKSNCDVQTLTLQYRISMDAVAPSKFVALYENGMTLGLKIHWKLNPARKQELDALIARLEAEQNNAQEFIATARWIHEGFELEVYDIEKKTSNHGAVEKIP